MPSFAFVTVDVFTDRRFGGNPLAVFPDARGMSDADMQSLAAEFNLSETTFVLPPADPANTARVRIFNRKAEMPFAGHPNVGTGWVLAKQGRAKDGTLRFEEIAGTAIFDRSSPRYPGVVGKTIAFLRPQGPFVVGGGSWYAVNRASVHKVLAKDMSPECLRQQLSEVISEIRAARST